MPITIIPKNVRTMLHFGAGDIHITDAKMKQGDGEGSPLVIFHQMEPRPIGSSAPELHGSECDDFAVGMTFTRHESIDAIVAVLNDFKAKHFPPQKYYEGSSGISCKQRDCTPAEMAEHSRLYFDLLFAVGQKHEGESRHETAKRYILEGEATSGPSESVGSTVAP